MSFTIDLQMISSVEALSGGFALCLPTEIGVEGNFDVISPSCPPLHNLSTA